MRRALLIPLLCVFVSFGCGAEPEAPAPEAVTNVQDVLMQCISGKVEEALPLLDSLDAAPSDVFAVRAMCYQQRFAADSARADAVAAMENLDEAIALSDSGAIFRNHELHSRRAFARLSLDPDDYQGALVDFEQAVAFDSLRPGYRLDRGVALGASGDTVRARADFRWVLDSSGATEEVQAMARQRLGSME